MLACQRGPTSSLALRSFPRVVFALLIMSCASACKSDDDPGSNDVDDAAVTTTTDLPQDVDAVLEAHCRECHSRPTRNFAPFPLVTWEDTQAQAPGYDRGVLIYDVIQMRIHDASFPMPPAPRDISDDDRSIIDQWIETGAQPKH